MKVAAVSDDGATISAHFGRAQFYVVLTIEEGRVTAREQRRKPGHSQFVADPAVQGEPATEHDHEHDHGAPGHGRDPASQARHGLMAAAIADCEVCLTRGMGRGAYESLQAAGIRPILTTVREIDAAVADLLAGRLEDHPEKLH